MRLDSKRSLLHASLLSILAIGMAATPAFAQRKIDPQRINGQRTGGQLYRNPAGQALGNGSVMVPNGLLGNNAMGFGNALDSSLEVGSGGQNFRSARTSAYSYQNLQARNLVVTNNVAGGRGFRGDEGYLITGVSGAGYNAPGDFMGSLGSDDTYGFNRDSSLSSLNFLGTNRAIDPFNIAQGVGVFQYRRDFTALPEINTMAGVRKINDAEIRLDRANSAIDSRSLLSTAVAPDDIGVVAATESSRLQASASAVRGVQYRPYGSSVFTDLYGEAMMNGERIRSEEEAIGPRIQPFQTRFNAEDAPVPPERIEAQLDSSEAYKNIMQRVYEQYEGRDDVKVDVAGLQRMRDDFGQVQAQLAPIRIGDPDEERPVNVSERREGLPGDREPIPGLNDLMDEGEEEDDFEDPNASDDAEDQKAESKEDETEEEASGARSVEDLIKSLTHRTELTTFVDPKMEARVSQVATQGEEAMQEGKYFRAEDRFSLALKLSPGNPILEAGLANSQIGAGLYRSAAVSLTFLYRKHPEMIDVGWSESARPTRTRMLLAADDVRKMISRDPDGSNGLGLLIAYIGRQLGDRALIKEGLDFIEDPRIISLVPQLREIWLSDAGFSD